jgi:hypothetical protein
VAKLDTIVHELYHVDPTRCGIRRILRADGSLSPYAHSPEFFTDVAHMVRGYLATGPDPAVYDFLREDFTGLTAKYGGMVGTTFKGFPSYPQRYTEVASDQPELRDLPVRIEPLKRPALQTRYTSDDLYVRQFLADTSRRLVRTGEHRAA